MTGPALFTAEQVTLRYRRAGRTTVAVRDVGLEVGVGDVVGVVGESGSGKSSLARCIVGLARPDEGRMTLDGVELGRRRTHRQYRDIQMVFQDPRSALNPRMSVFDIIQEGWRAHPAVDPVGRRAAAVELLDAVGLSPALIDRRPSELSGGQAQRVAIARALAVKPRLLVCDEAVSALDVSVQTQVLQLLVRIQAEMSLSMVFISHDLGVVRQVAGRVSVMYRGEVVESGPTDEVFTAPTHDYTRMLLDAALDLATDLDGPRR